MGLQRSGLKWSSSCPIEPDRILMLPSWALTCKIVLLFVVLYFVITHNRCSFNYIHLRFAHPPSSYLHITVCTHGVPVELSTPILHVT